jgi:hypothetical protein
LRGTNLIFAPTLDVIIRDKRKEPLKDGTYHGGLAAGERPRPMAFQEKKTT